MRGRTGIGVLGALAVGGCIGTSFGGDRPEMAYLPPSSPPAVVPGAYVGQPRFLVFGNVVDRLVQQGLEIQTSDQEAGRIVAIYWGDPAPYIDCGWIVTYDDDGLESTPAAAPSASFERRLNGRIVDVEREMDLNAVLSVDVSERGSATVVRTTSDYALTKKALAPGRGRPLGDETIRFGTGETASFEIGTTCQPNGEFERLVLDALPSVTLPGG
ncbi:MAG TPA: hypothetical protein VFZ01_11850 [Geminicoccaceae bacterium]